MNTDNNNKNFPSPYRRTVNKIRSCDWFGDEDVNLLCKTFMEIGSEGLSQILHTNGFVSSENLKSLHNPAGMPKEEQEKWKNKKTIIIDTMNMEVLCSHFIGGQLFDEYMSAETEKKTIVIEEHGNTYYEEMYLPKEGPLRKRKTNPSKPPLKKKVVNPDPRYFKKNKYEPNTVTFDYYEVLNILDLELEENWLENVCLILIPVHGPHLTLKSINKTDYGFETERNHWSLLCYSPWKNIIFHYDTVTYGDGSTLNMERAVEIISVLKMLSVIPLECKEKITYDDHWIPRQSYGYECGYYMCYFILMILVKIPNRPLSSSDIQEKYTNWVDVAKNNAFTVLITKIFWEKFALDNIFSD